MNLEIKNNTPFAKERTAKTISHHGVERVVVKYKGPYAESTSWQHDVLNTFVKSSNLKTTLTVTNGYDRVENRLFPHYVVVDRSSNPKRISGPHYMSPRVDYVIEEDKVAATVHIHDQIILDGIRKKTGGRISKEQYIPALNRAAKNGLAGVLAAEKRYLTQSSINNVVLDTVGTAMDASVVAAGVGPLLVGGLLDLASEISHEDITIPKTLIGLLKMRIGWAAIGNGMDLLLFRVKNFKEQNRFSTTLDNDSYSCSRSDNYNPFKHIKDRIQGGWYLLRHDVATAEPDNRVPIK